MCSDEDLMTAVARGNINAFEQILQRYQSLVWRITARFVGNASDAQDITQNIFLRLFESAQRYRKKALFKTFLFRMVTNACIDYARTKHPVSFHESSDVCDPARPVSDALIINERDKILRQAIGALPVRQRFAIALKYDVDLSIRDIAEVLETTEKAAERLLAHARKTLNGRLKKNELFAGDL